MDPFEALYIDHRLIERVLDALLTFSRRLGDGAEPADLMSFVVLLAEFADARHHGKEDILFEAMGRAGFPSESGPIATMLREHAEGRKLVSILRTEADHAGAWTVRDHSLIADTSRSFVRLLRAHIQKEDAILYPMARHNLSLEAIATLGARFDEMEGSEDAVAERAAFRAMASMLSERYTDDPVRWSRPAAIVLN